MNSREPTSAEPTGAPSPFEKHTDTLSKWRRDRARRRARIAAERDRGVEQARAVEVGRQAAPARERASPSAMYAIGSTLPPIVFSRQSRRLARSARRRA